jgi:regulator of replication initiation timing
LHEAPDHDIRVRLEQAKRELELAQSELIRVRLENQGLREELAEMHKLVDEATNSTQPLQPKQQQKRGR